MLEQFTDEEIAVLEKELAIRRFSNCKAKLMTEMPEFQVLEEIVPSKINGIPNLTGGAKKKQMILCYADNILGLYRRNGRGMLGLIRIPGEHMALYQAVVKELIGAIKKIYDRYESLAASGVGLIEETYFLIDFEEKRSTPAAISIARSTMVNELYAIL